VAAPVASDAASALLEGEADALAVLQVPPALQSIGEWYWNFEQVGDAEVRSLLEKAWTGSEAAPV
jgi:predicted phosphoribosyltransferase